MQEDRAAYVPSAHAQRAVTLSELGIRPALLLGFALTIGIWMVAYYYFSRRIETLEHRQTALSASYQTAQDLLSLVRSEVLAGAVAVRNAVLEEDPDDVDNHRRRIDTARLTIDASLEKYDAMFRGEPALDTQVQRLQLALLKQEVTEFREKTTELLGLGHPPWSQNLTALLNREMTPIREATMSVAETLLRLNREGFIEEQSKVSAAYKAAQQSILGALGFALLASLGVAIVLSRYAGRLESRERRQHARDIDNALNLQRLTARLVTAQEEERRHIARELHDEVGQVLTVVKMALRDAQCAIRTGSSSNQAVEALEEARVVSDKALQAIRDLSRLLHPSLLDDMGLAVALDAHIKGFGRRHNISVAADYDNIDARLPPEIELALYRTVQEALTNVARHASATTVTVSVRRTGDAVDVTIEDNGVGFDAVRASQPGPNRGLGLLGMQERVHQFGGEMVLESKPGRGARVFASFPLRPVVTTVRAGDLTPAVESEGTHA